MSRSMKILHRKDHAVERDWQKTLQMHLFKVQGPQYQSLVFQM